MGISEPPKPKRPGRYKGVTEAMRRAIKKYSQTQRCKDKVRRRKKSPKAKETQRIYDRTKRAPARQSEREKSAARIDRMKRLAEKNQRVLLGKRECMKSINKFTDRVIKDLRSRGLKRRLRWRGVLGGRVGFVRDIIQSKFLRGMDWTNYKTVWMLVHEKQLETATTLEELLPLLHAKNLKPVRIQEISRFVHKVVM